MGNYRANAVTRNEKGELTDIELEHVDDPPYKLLFSGALPKWLEDQQLKQGKLYTGTFSFIEAKAS